ADGLHAPSRVRGRRRAGARGRRGAPRERLSRRRDHARPRRRRAGRRGPPVTLAAGEVVILPTDTVYGLCAAATEEGTERLYAVKGRAARQPTALVAATVDQLLAAVPELDGALVRSLLPGPFTLVVPNPACRYAWLTGERPDAIGVRVPEWPASAARAVATAGPV